MERPAKTAVIRAERGLVNRVSDDPVLMKKLEKQGFPTKPYPGFMDDRNVGIFACIVSDKGQRRGGHGPVCVRRSFRAVHAWTCFIFSRRKWKRLLPTLYRMNIILEDFMP